MYEPSLEVEGGEEDNSRYYEPPDEVVEYLRDMQDAVRYALHVAYRMTLREEKHRLPPSFSYRPKTGSQGVVLLQV